MDNFIWLICDECGRGFDVKLDLARYIWKNEEQGVPVTCGNCDAIQREKEVADAKTLEADQAQETGTQR